MPMPEYLYPPDRKGDPTSPRKRGEVKQDSHRSLGSSASRRPSPTRLNDSTTRKIANPGQIAIHGALVRNRCAALSMLPQDGAGGCWPKPKNDNAASAMIAAAIDSVACTNSAGMMLGRI